VLRAPEVFSQRDEDGVVVVLTDEPPADQHGLVRLAVDLCPSRAISANEHP
jgi:ferredoxin